LFSPFPLFLLPSFSCTVRSLVADTMTNWNDPVLEVSEALALIKLSHVVAGLYIWELVLNLDYEYSIITGKRKFNLAVPFYLGCRWFALSDVILHLTNLDTTGGIDCQAWAVMEFLSGYFGFLSAACLIILRIYALWERKKIVLAVALAALLSSAVSFVYNVATLHAYRIATYCDIYHLLHTRVTIYTSFITDLVLLSLMLFGVLRWKEARIGGIWRIMYTQGIVYVLVATLADVPTVTFLSLNLNDPMNEMFTFPSLIILSIGAARMYRGLVDSATLNDPLGGLVGATGLSTVRFARPDLRKQGTPNSGKAGLDTANSERILSIKTQDDESFGSETA